MWIFRLEAEQSELDKKWRMKFAILQRRYHELLFGVYSRDGQNISLIHGQFLANVD